MNSPPVVYRIANSYNYASVNLVNALANELGFEYYHFLTGTYPSSLPERGYFPGPQKYRLVALPMNTREEINRRLALANLGKDRTEEIFADNWKFGRPSPDMLVINYNSGISPNIKTLFPNQPTTLFFAEYFRVSDFYTRREWPMPKSLLEMDTNYVKKSSDYAENCDAIVVPSKYAKSLWPERFQHKVHAIFEGFDTDFLAPERIHRLSKFGQLVKRRFQGKRLVAYIGETIEPIRGFDRWMEVYLSLRKRYDDLHFIVISSDRIKYGDIGKPHFHGVNSFKDWTMKKLGLKGSEMMDISWLNFLPLNDYLSLLSALDVVIYPMYGMFSNWSLYHALHMGTPVVASDRAYLPEVIVDGENGFLANPDESEALAKKAAAILDSAELSAQFKKKGRDTVEQRFSLTQTAEKISRLLDSMGLPLEKTVRYDAKSCSKIAFYVVFDTGHIKLIRPLLESISNLSPNPPPLYLADRSQDGIPPKDLADHPNVVYRYFPQYISMTLALNVMLQTHPTDLAIKIEPWSDLPGPGWLEKLLGAYKETPRLVGGRLSPLNEQDATEETLSFPLDIKRLLTSRHKLDHMAPDIMVISDAVFESCGYLDERVVYSLHHTEFSLRVQSMDFELVELA